MIIFFERIWAGQLGSRSGCSIQVQNMCQILSINSRIPRALKAQLERISIPNSSTVNGQLPLPPNQFDHFCLLNHAQCSPNFRTSKETCCSAKMYTVHFPHHIEIMRSRGGKMTRGIANLWGFLAGQKGFKMYHFFINTQVEHGKLASKIRAPVFWENCRLSLVISYESYNVQTLRAPIIWETTSTPLMWVFVIYPPWNYFQGRKC